MPQAHPASAQYNSAAVCRRGHVQTAWLEHHGTDEKCGTCGAPVLVACPACGWHIPSGRSGDWTFDEKNWKPPDFCTKCAAAWPWASDDAIIYEIENRLDQQPDLSEGDRRMLRRQLETARKSLGGADEESKLLDALKFARDRAPAAFNAALPVIQAIATTWVKLRLNQPPT